ncbi:hypothetical protein PC116_g33255, partial [Phytophthora cactorum]
IAQAGKALRRLVVGPSEVEEREADGVDVRGGGQGGEFSGYFFGGIARTTTTTTTRRREAQVPLQRRAYPSAYLGKKAGQGVRREDAAGDVSRAAVERGQGARVGLDLHEAAVLFAEGAVADERGEGEVQQVGEGAGLGGPGVRGAGAEEPSVKLGDLVREEALEVGVFLVRADYVGGEG